MVDFADSKAFAPPAYRAPALNDILAQTIFNAMLRDAFEADLDLVPLKRLSVEDMAPAVLPEDKRAIHEGINNHIGTIVNLYNDQVRWCLSQCERGRDVTSEDCMHAAIGLTHQIYNNRATSIEEVATILLFCGLIADPSQLPEPFGENLAVAHGHFRRGVDLTPLLSNEGPLEEIIYGHLPPEQRDNLFPGRHTAALFMQAALDTMELWHPHEAMPVRRSAQRAIPGAKLRGQR